MNRPKVAEIVSASIRHPRLVCPLVGGGYALVSAATSRGMNYLTEMVPANDL